MDETSACIMCGTDANMMQYGCDDHGVCHDCYVVCGHCDELTCPNPDHCVECQSECGTALCRGCSSRLTCDGCAPTIDSIARSFASMSSTRIRVIQ